MQNIDGKNVCESLAEVVDPCRAALVVVEPVMPAILPRAVVVRGSSGSTPDP